MWRSPPGPRGRTSARATARPTSCGPPRPKALCGVCRSDPPTRRRARPRGAPTIGASAPVMGPPTNPMPARRAGPRGVGARAEAARAAPWGSDYWSIGPGYGTANNPDAGPALGPEGFERLARSAPLGMPVIGIGGIAAVNPRAIVRAGAVGVAVIGAVMGAADPEQAARAIRAMIPG